MQGKQLTRFALCVLATTVTSCLAALPITNPPIVAPTTSVSSTPTPTPTPSAQIWNLKNADIRAVIQTISVLTGKNFIIDPRVHGNITLLSQKPMAPDELYQVFLSMLQMLNYAAIPSGNIIKIVPSTDANALSRQIATKANPGKGDEIVVRVVSVNHVSATELVPVLRPLMSQSSTVTAYLPSNSLILAGTASNIKRLVGVVRQMDVVNSDQISVVRLHYANAEKVVSIIRELQSGAASHGLTSNSTLAADAENNGILISANTANQLVMHRLIKQLDQPGSGGDDTRVVTLNYLSAKKLAPILQKIAQGMATSESKAAGKTAVAGAMSGGSDISIEPEVDTNAIIMHAPVNLLSGLMRVIRRLDVRPQEVLVEAIIVKIDENLLNKLGIVWGTSDGAANTSGSTTTASANIASVNTAVLKVNHGVGFLPDGNLIAILHALKSNSASDVLATPSVVVLNNGKALISDGQNIGMANRSYQGVTPTPGATENIIAPYNTIERQDVGLSLDVSPHISPNQMIRMDLLQKDDSVASTNESINPDNPTLNTSQIKTSVLVKSGDVLVLGGLMNNSQQKAVQKLPILGDLPLIGHFFRYNTHQLDKTSLMVFIRPVIMSKRLAHLQTMNRYAYVRHQEIDLETEAVKKHDAMPLLPELKREPSTHLPPPTSAMVVLPMPVITDHRSRITKNND